MGVKQISEAPSFASTQITLALENALHGEGNLRGVSPGLKLAGSYLLLQTPTLLPALKPAINQYGGRYAVRLGIDAQGGPQASRRASL